MQTIETTRVAKDDTDRPVPASFSVRRAGQNSTTDLEGSNSRHDVTLSDADFTPEGLVPCPAPTGMAERVARHLGVGAIGRKPPA